MGERTDKLANDLAGIVGVICFGAILLIFIWAIISAVWSTLTCKSHKFMDYGRGHQLVCIVE